MKTFNSVEETRKLHVSRLGEDCVTLVINYKDAGRSGITLPPSDAPALALAILEAAGYTEDSRGLMEYVIGNLKEIVSRQAKATAEAEEQAKLEAEALKLFNASRLERGLDELDWVRVTPSERAEWLAVARKARELAKEAGE